MRGRGDGGGKEGWGGEGRGIATGNCSDTAVTIHLNEGYKSTVPVSGELFSREVCM